MSNNMRRIYLCGGIENNNRHIMASVATILRGQGDHVEDSSENQLPPETPHLWTILRRMRIRQMTTCDMILVVGDQCDAMDFEILAAYKLGLHVQQTGPTDDPCQIAWLAGFGIKVYTP